MKIRFWGTRGSIPSPGPSTLRYGGNTSCVEVRLNDGTLLILDGGSGIRPLGYALGASDAVLLLSHYHWDHIQGMPFFGPAYLPQSNLRILGPESGGKGPGALLTEQMLAPFFPAPASDWLGIREFDVVRPGEPFTIGSARIRAGRLSHPGVTFGYRIEDAGTTFVYASDDEPEVASPEILAETIELASGADLLLHDCQYFESEYAARHHWGHSTPSQAVGLASEAGVRRLLLFHHDPTHSDEQVEAMAEEARGLAGRLDILIGQEGETLVMGEEPAMRQIG